MSKTGKKWTLLLGLGALIAGVTQFLVFHLIVQASWAEPYSWAHNNISDLGNQTCAFQSDPEPRYICSPDHGLMNESFIRLGALIVIGLLLTGPLWRRGARSAIARGLLTGLGVGWILAGLAPADVNENLHVLGAVLIMLTGSIGLLLAGSRLNPELPAVLRCSSAPLAVLALVAFGLFLSRNYLGLGMGGMERVAAFLSLVWLFALGAVMLPRALRSSARDSSLSA